MKKFLSINFPKAKLITLFFIIFANFSFAQDTNKIDVLNVDYLDFLLKHKITENKEAQIQIYNPIFKNNPFNLYLGNLGQAAYPINYFGRKNEKYLLFNNSYSIYKQDVEMYNTEIPMTDIDYSTGLLEEIKLKFTHAQKINEKMRFGFDYNYLSSQGYYYNQGTKDNFLSFYYTYLGKRYKLILSHYFSKLNTQENGGITNYTDNPLPEIEKVNLSFAKKIIRSHHFTALQKLKLTSDTQNDSILSKNIELIHCFEYIDDFNRFEDTKPNKNFYKTLKDTTNINELATAQTFKNTALISFKNTKTILNLGAEIENSYQNSKKLDTALINISSIASIQRNFTKQMGIFLYSKYVFAGYNKNDFVAIAKIKKTFKDSSNLSIQTDWQMNKANYFLQRIQTNQYAWNNNFKPTSEFKFSLNFENTKYDAEFKVFYSNINNFIYFDEGTKFSQNTKPIDVFGASIKKNINIYIFNVYNHLLYQYTTASKNSIALPEFCYYNSSYFNIFLFKKALKMKLGADFYLYYQMPNYYYDPFLGTFYSKNEILKKDIIYDWNTFLNLNIKRLHFFVKYSLANSIYTVLNYPQNPKVIKLGFSWRFWN